MHYLSRVGQNKYAGISDDEDDYTCTRSFN